MKIDLLAMLAGKWEDGARPADLYEAHVKEHPRVYLDALFEALVSRNKRVQGGAAEMLSRLSADHPALVYPHVEVFVGNLASRQPILRWEAACTLGNLAGVDDKKVVSKQTEALIRLLGDKSIVLQGHAVKALAKIAQHDGHLAARILDALIEASACFPGTRIGYVVEATEAFAVYPKLHPVLRGFLAPHVERDHAPVARKARRAMKRLDA